MTELTLNAYAKINLYLEVTGKRPNGYHDLVSVMQSVSLCDTLHFARTAGQEIVLDCGGVLENDDSNLICRAAKAYFFATKAPFGLSVRLEKRIPMAAGLGGGSADAAATLRALDLLDGGRLPQARLFEIAASIGADVPFCLAGGTRLCRGIGEQMQEIPNRLSCFFVITIGPEGVSTPMAFAALDARYAAGFPQEGERLGRLLSVMEQGNAKALAPCLYNMFEEVVEPMRPAVAACKRMLREGGALQAMMSGSGPSVFGVFESEQAAHRAATALLAAGYRAYPCQAILPK